MEKFLEKSAERIASVWYRFHDFIENRISVSDVRVMLLLTMCIFFAFSSLMYIYDYTRLSFSFRIYFVIIVTVLFFIGLMLMSIYFRIKKQKLPFKFVEINSKKSKPEKFGMDKKNFILLCQLSCDRSLVNKIDISEVYYNDFFTMLDLMIVLKLPSRGKTKREFLKFIRDHFVKNGEINKKNLKSVYSKWYSRFKKNDEKLYLTKQEEIKQYFFLKK